MTVRISWSCLSQRDIEFTALSDVPVRSIPTESAPFTKMPRGTGSQLGSETVTHKFAA
jgi:hypothetical protein